MTDRWGRSSARQADVWILYLSPIPWTGPRQRQHELARQLARGFRVLFVEPPTPGGAKEVEPVAVEENVFLLKPRGPFPLARLVPPLNALVRRRLSSRLARWLSEQGAPGVLWIDEDLAAACAGRCGESAVVYDAVDEDWTFTRRWNRWHLRRALRRARGRALLTVASSETLARRLPASASPTVVVPNACDPELFSPAGEIAAELADLPSPVVGFVGTASARALDVRLLDSLARRRPEWSFVFVGRYEERVERMLAQNPNIHLLGEVPYERLPAFIRGFDACLIPYRFGGAVDYVFPKKLFEYLATGRPVVSTPLPEVCAFAPHVRVASTPDTFAAAIVESLTEDGTAATRRRALALRNTWDDRGAVVRQLVADLIEAS